jgi:hypothetical protein
MHLATVFYVICVVEFETPVVAALEQLAGCGIESAVRWVVVVLL